MVDQGYDYAKVVDEAVENSVSDVMCVKDKCPCPEIDTTKWSPSD